MYLMMRYLDGTTIDGVGLAISKDRIRLVVPGSFDTIELRREYSQWMNEAGEPVEFAALLPEPGEFEFFAGLYPRVMCAN